MNKLKSVPVESHHESQDKDANYDLLCDILILVATTTEKEKLHEVAQELGYSFVKRRAVSRSGEEIKFYRVGSDVNGELLIGQNRVNVVRTKMGPFSYGGSASRAINLRIATGASAIIQLGMAFGVDLKLQKTGDVLVSTSIIPYDFRVIRPNSQEVLVGPGNEASGVVGSADLVANEKTDSGYYVDYSSVERHKSKETLLSHFLDVHEVHKYPFRVHFGGILSGGARIYSRKYLGELIHGIIAGDDNIIGGEMEGVGLLSVSPSDDPIWIVVKGISDYADEDRDRIIEKTRPIACRNAAYFVLTALSHY